MSSEKNLSNSNGEQSDDHEEAECSVHPESQSSKIIFHTESLATKYKENFDETDNMNSNGCCKESEYSVNPSNKSYFSIINAKSAGSKIKACNEAFAKEDQYFSEESEEPKSSRKQSFDTASNLEKEQFSDRFSKKEIFSIKHTTLASINTINVKTAACQYEAENNMLDSKVLETNVIASEESVESGAKY